MRAEGAAADGPIRRPSEPSGARAWQAERAEQAGEGRIGPLPCCWAGCKHSNKVSCFLFYFRSILNDVLMNSISIQICTNVYFVREKCTTMLLNIEYNFSYSRCKVLKLLLLILIQTNRRIIFKSIIKELTLSKFYTVLSLFNFEPTG